jgi:hypothetical protein
VTTNLGQNSWRFRIYSKRLVWLLFAKINIGKSSNVNERVEIDAFEFDAHLIQIVEIELGVIETRNVEFLPVFVHERSAQPASGSGDYDFHSSVAALYASH